jgi:hypothetical protein
MKTIILSIALGGNALRAHGCPTRPCSQISEGRTILVQARGAAARRRGENVAGAKSSKAKRARLLSTMLYAVSVILIVVVAFLYFRDRGHNTQAPPTPPSVAGQNQLINVIDAFQKQGLTAKAGPGGAHVDELTPPGQHLDVNGKTVYIFVYDSPDDRKADTDGVDFSNLTLTSAGAAVPPDQLKASAASNIVAVLVGGDDALAAKIDAGVKALP